MSGKLEFLFNRTTKRSGYMYILTDNRLIGIDFFRDQRDDYFGELEFYYVKKANILPVLQRCQSFKRLNIMIKLFRITKVQFI